MISEIIDFYNKSGQFERGTLTIIAAMLGLFVLSWGFYFYSIIEYKIYNKRMLQLLIGKLNAKISELAKTHGVDENQIEIYFDKVNGFAYRVYNDLDDIIHDQTFKP